PNQPVAVKRAYYTEWLDGHNKLKRYPAQQEIELMTCEGDALYWVMSLMDMVYRFVKNHANQNPPNTPLIPIPEVHFVKAGVAISRNADGKPTKAVLIEELIDTDQEDFRKFVHNGSALPLPTAMDPDYELTCFLCFAQHVQWMKAGRLAFVSDFQGSAQFLSDPQIMTHPILNAWFSQGNLAATFRAFPDQHQCNHFCTFFELCKPEVFEEDPTF
ncbi:hypothetical protein K439DRAFT_1354108, partial [Ramaria rubella]